MTQRIFSFVSFQTIPHRQGIKFGWCVKLTTNNSPFNNLNTSKHTRTLQSE